MNLQEAIRRPLSSGPRRGPKVTRRRRTMSRSPSGRSSMSILSWIVLGAIAGWLAGLLVRGDEGLGIIGHIVLGIVGALLGGFLASVIFGTNPVQGALDIGSIVTATIGAVILVVVVNAVTGRRYGTPA